MVSDPVPTEAGKAALYWAAKSGDGYGEGAIGSPILVDGYLYYNQGKTINKMDAVSGESGGQLAAWWNAPISALFRLPTGTE